MAEESIFLKVAQEAALEAGKAILRFSKEELHVTTKAHVNDLATQADLESERIIIEILKREFPHHSVLSEEKGEDAKSSEYKWVIDPIDGTTAFTFGFPFFAVSIGLLKDNQPVLGVIYVVGADDMYWAEKDQGAYVNGVQISVSKRSNPKQAALFISLGNNPDTRVERFEKRIKPFVQNSRFIYMIGAVATEVAFVTRGFGDCVISKTKVWDIAAGAAILAEAGGTITDWEGNEIDWTNQSIEWIASNGSIHNEILRIYHESTKTG